MLRQLVAVTLCALLTVPAYSLENTPAAIPPHDQAIAGVYPKTRVWGSSEKILLHFRAVGRLSEKQPWGCANSSSKIALGSGVTYDYDAFGNIAHSTATGILPGGTSAAPTPNEFLFAGERFDSDLNLYYNRARYLNVSTGRFWTMDSFEGDGAAPSSLHKYLYTANDPIDRTDPTGKQFGLDATIAGAIGNTLNAMEANVSQAIIQGLICEQQGTCKNSNEFAQGNSNRRSIAYFMEAPFLPHFLGAPKSERLLLPKQAAALWEGTALFWEEPGKQRPRDCRAQELA